MFVRFRESSAFRLSLFRKEKRVGIAALVVRAGAFSLYVTECKKSILHGMPERAYGSQMRVLGARWYMYALPTDPYRFNDLVDSRLCAS